MTLLASGRTTMIRIPEKTSRAHNLAMIIKGVRKEKRQTVTESKDRIKTM